MGVTSLSDAEKFARLICGPHTKIQNYAARLPHVTEESFLLFVKGGCKQGRLSEIERCIENLLDQVKDSETKRGNIQNPGRGIFVKGGNPKTVYYHSAQLTAKECTCRVVFGADTKQSHITTSCSQWEAGEQFESILDSVLTKNSYAICEEIHGSQPVWLQKAWHAVMNFNNHRENHGIDYHVDYSATYHPEDPIVSFSFGHGGVLTLRSLSGKKKETMLFQEDGDVLIMAGRFQEEFQHGVPSRQNWESLKRQMGKDLSSWELKGLQKEVELHKQAGSAPDKRLNCTLRWHTRHYQNCPWACEDPSQRVFRGMKKANNNREDDEKSGDERLKIMAEVMKTCWTHISVKNELDLLKSWSIGGTHLALSPKEALKEVSEVVFQKQIAMSKISEAFQKMGLGGYEPDFTLYHLVSLACSHLHNVYANRDVLSIHNGRNNYFSICAGSHTQNRLHNINTEPWVKFLLNHHQLSHVLKALDADMTVERGQLAVLLEKVLPSILPQKIKAAKQPKDKRKSDQLELYDVDCWSSSNLLLIKAFEIGFVPSESSTPPAPTRLQTRKDICSEVFTKANKHRAIQAVQGLVNGYMSFLQCVDNKREFQNNTSRYPSERYDMYFWAMQVPKDPRNEKPTKHAKPVR